MAGELAAGPGDGWRGPRTQLGGPGSTSGAVVEDLTNAAGSAVVVGEVVRINGDNTFTRAQASSATGVRGTVGVVRVGAADTAIASVGTNGRLTVLLEAGLQPLAGDPLWVSPNTAGRATTREPTNFVVPIGTIKDASPYGVDGTVIADVSVIGLTSGQGGSPYFADWSIAGRRFYALDPDVGDDDNDGYSDVDMATAGAVAMRTQAALDAIIPPHGNQRQIVVAVKPRAGGVTIAEDYVWRGKVGYRNVVIEATTDFSDTATDQVLAGAVIAPAGTGPNADGSWTVAAAPAPTAATWAIAAGALPAEDTIVTKRVRFKGNVTAALTNVVVEIAIVVAGAGGTITGSANLAVAPAAGDEFFIEHAGVAFQKVLISGEGMSAASTVEGVFPSAGRGITLKGFASTDATVNAFVIIGPAQAVNVGFCEQRGSAGFAYIKGIEDFRASRTVRNQTGGAVNVGTGLRCEGGYAAIDCLSFTAAESGWTSSVSSGAGFVNLGTYIIGALGGYAGSGVIMQNCGWGGVPETTGDAFNTFGRDPFGAATSRGMRIVAPPAVSAVAGLLVKECNGQFSGFSVENMGALPAMLIKGVGSLIRVDDATGSTGNTDVGIDVTGCKGSQIILGSVIANTMTGTAGDIRLNGPVITTHVGIRDITNVVDRAQNNVQGAPGSIHVGQCELVVNGTVGAMLIGQIVRSTGASGSVAPAQANTAANATGVVGVMVTPPAAGTFGYRANSDTLVVRMDAVPVVGNICYLSEATAGNGRDTPPAAAATNQKLRHGYIETATVIAGVNYAFVPWTTEMVPILSDGVAP